MGQKTKMYILVPDDLPPGYEMVAVAHASLQCYLAYKNTPNMIEWLSTSFRKVVCKVTREELETSQLGCPDSIVTTESSLDNKKVAISFCPRPAEEWPEKFKYYPLWK